jgi:F-type H+-transporting ATPase subunit gamma
MAERLTDIVSQIRNVRQLHAVVTAMRGIAASRAQQGRTLLPGIEAYSAVVARAIGAALHLLPPEDRASPSFHRSGCGLILFCAEQGFAGAFTERVLDAAGDVDGATLFLVGTRGAIVAGERGIKPAWSAPMATHVGTIPGFANRLIDALYTYSANASLRRVEILFSRAVPGGGSIEVIRRWLLPLDTHAFSQQIKTQPPLTTLMPVFLLEKLAAEYVYAQICEASMQAYAAENEARMRAMTSARANIESRLATLVQREHRLRQEEITTEIIELAAGADALLKLSS